MNKKGFTLFEMMAVISLLLAISIIAVPQITGSMKKRSNDKYNLFLNDVFLATEAYIQQNSDDYPELNNVGGKAYIYMVNLVEEDFLSSNLVNPKYCDASNNCSSKKISTCDSRGVCTVDDYTVIATTTEDGTYTYELRNGIISS